MSHIGTNDDVWAWGGSPDEVYQRKCEDEASLIKENTQLRRIIWLNHGCPTGVLTNKDKGMYCHQCNMDFATAAPAEIKGKAKRGLACKVAGRKGGPTKMNTTAEKDRHYICEIGRLFWGDDKQCYAPEAVYRKVKAELFSTSEDGEVKCPCCKQPMEKSHYFTDRYCCQNQECVLWLNSLKLPTTRNGVWTG